MGRLLIAATVSVLASSIAFAQTENVVVRLDPALDALVSPAQKSSSSRAASVSQKAPVWVQKDSEGYLLFTDIPGNVVWKLTLDGQASVYLENVGYNGLKFGAGRASRTTAREN